MKVLSETRLIPVRADESDLLAVSALMDETSYRNQASLSHDVDPAAHYLREGWLQGLNPFEGFDGEFLRPYYEASNLHGPPALRWLELLAMPGRRPPTTKSEAETVANLVRTYSIFDVGTYAKRLPSALDPALHYAVVGELLGWCPSSVFDPSFYLEMYEDIGSSGLSPLEHYVNHGKHEQRRAVPAANRLAFEPLPDNGRPAVLLLVHDSSRTGAPLLAWNIARRLAETYNVVALLMRGGVLEDAFKAVSAVTVGPMVWEEWRPEEMRRVAERLVAAYDPLYTVANSIESHLLVPALAKLGVPSVALVHEFAAYTRPVARMRDVLDWATHVVYPATLVAQSSFDVFPAFAHRRGVHVLSQGLVDLPRTQSETPTAEDRRRRAGDIASLVRPKDAADSFVVLGLGAVQLRKGVDLFLAAAANARRLAPELRFRFVFIGDGYDPVGDSSYSVYLAEQIIRSGLTDIVVMLDAVEDLDPAYDNADAFLLSSRLDPQPNVGIDAITRGIPTVCFEGASGTAEILAKDPLTRSLVVPHLDAHAAAEVLCRLARDPSALADIRMVTARLGAAAYDTAAYVHQVDVWGRAAAAALQAKDLQTLAEARIIDADLALPPDVLAPGALGVERHVLQQWAVVGTSLNQVANSQFRRPCAGFHPQAYAKAHPEACCEGAANPLAHWLRAGRPYGHWARQVFSPLHDQLLVPEPVRVALHAHFYYVSSAPYLAELLANNATSCDLFLSTNTQSKAAQLRSVFAAHRGAVDIRVMPNRGRDIGPLFTGLAEEITNGGYDMFGHVHGKQSLSVDATMGSVWRDFLWDNLIGSTHPMLDLAAAAIATQPDIGLLIAEDPHLVGWDQNRDLAERLASQMGFAGPLEDFFDFPLGTMFWARPRALRPLLALNLTWEDYPAEPLAEDGTLLHALERLLPFAAQQAGLRVAGLRAPGTTW